MNLEVALLGRGASTDVKLIQLIQVVTGESGTKYTFNDGFNGLEQVDGEYHIKLRARGAPFHLPTSSRPATNEYLAAIHRRQIQDPVCCKLMEYCIKKADQVNTAFHQRSCYTRTASQDKV